MKNKNNLIIKKLIFFFRLKDDNYKKKIFIYQFKNYYLFKKMLNKKICDFIYLDLLKNRKINLVKIFFHKFFYKNFILIYVFNNEIKINNFIPEWPGNYYSKNFFLNLCLWFKIFLRFFFKNHLIYFIVFKKK